MPARFVSLASGSSGNSALVDTGSARLLIDCGLRPAELSNRLQRVGLRPADITAVVLTHTHGDHWNRDTFALLRTLDIPLYAHEKHHIKLCTAPVYEPLRRAGLARLFAAGEPLRVAPRLTVLPVPVPHDSDPTFGFRVSGTDFPSGEPWALGYSSDCGHPCPAVAAAFEGVNVLAIEFNHDVAMQRASRRPAFLVNRVLGPTGHLSNAQAADLAIAVAETAEEQAFTALVQLHLSRDCNTTALATCSGREALSRVAPHAKLVTATQSAPTVSVPIAGAGRKSVQLTLPEC